MVKNIWIFIFIISPIPKTETKSAILEQERISAPGHWQ